MTAQPAPARTWFLDVPWEERALAKAAGARWDPTERAHVWNGNTLPEPLRRYRADDYSWLGFRQRLHNGDRSMPPAPAPTLFPREHQTVATNLMLNASRAGARGFLLGDDVGLGKTISVATFLQHLTRTGLYGNRPVRTILIVCPLAVVPHWKRTIRDVGGVHAHVVVTNYDKLKQLINGPDTTRTASGKKRKRRMSTRQKNRATVTKGTPKTNWDVVVLDEAHACRHDSQRTNAAAMLARYAGTAATAPFVVWMSATAGQNPLELRYLTPLFAQLTKAPQSGLRDFGRWLADNGFHVTRNDRFDTWEWTEDPTERNRDVERMRRFLFDRPVPVALRRLPTDLAGWPPVTRVPIPVELTLADRARYGLAWAEFKRQTHAARDLPGKERNEAGRVARLRFRQKASLLRVPGTVGLVEMLLDRGMQVVVSCEFLGSLDEIKDKLTAKKVKVTVLDGRDRENREQHRLRFQTGDATVALITPVEGFSLHAGEQLAGGKTATTVPRATVVHDPRYSALQALQVEGRAHRDGQAATVYLPYASGTVEEQILQRMVSRMESTKAMVGDDTSSIRDLESLLDKAAT